MQNQNTNQEPPLKRSSELKSTAQPVKITKQQPMTSKPNNLEFKTVLKNNAEQMKKLNENEKILNENVNDNKTKIVDVRQGQTVIKGSLTKLLNQQGILNTNQEDTTQTIENLNDLVKHLRSDQQALQSLMQRVDALEQTPDATKAMLVEYVRNFDTTVKTLNVLAQNQSYYAKKEQEALVQIANKQITINRETLTELEQLVQKETGFALQKYVSEVQRKAINANFNAFNKSLQSRLNDVDGDITRTLDTLSKTLKKANMAVESVNKLWIVVGVLFVLQILTSFNLYVNSFVSNPVISSIIALIAVVLVVGVVYLNWRDHND